MTHFRSEGTLLLSLDSYFYFAFVIKINCVSFLLENDSVCCHIEGFHIFNSFICFG